MSVCTVDGQRFNLGDVNDPFTIQSCSKPFTYGINVDKLGPEVVDKYIGQEPSGRDFNEICLDSKSQFLLKYLHSVSYYYAVLPFYDVKCLCSRGRELGREGSHSH